MKNVKELVNKQKQDEKMIHVINYMFAITIMLLVGTHMLGILNISTYIYEPLLMVLSISQAMLNWKKLKWFI